MTARDRFNGIEATFWDCQDSEHLTHEDPIEALESFVDSHLERGRDTAEVIREMGAITCEGYERKTISESAIIEAAELALDTVVEDLDDPDEYGDPDGDRAMFKVDALAKHRPAFVAAVRALIADAFVWQCERTHSVELTPDETIEILREERPDWFEAESSPAPAAEVPA